MLKTSRKFQTEWASSFLWPYLCFYLRDAKLEENICSNTLLMNVAAAAEPVLIIQDVYTSLRL